MLRNYFVDDGTPSRSGSTRASQELPSTMMEWGGNSWLCRFIDENALAFVEIALVKGYL